MKKQFTTAIEKKVFTLLVAFTVVFCSSVKTFALPDRPVAAIKGTHISYKGLQNQMLVFKIDYKNEAAKDFVLIIKNEQNDIMYSKKFEAKPLNTEVHLSEVPENCKLTFFIKSSDKTRDYTQAFEIKSQVKMVEEYIVKGL